MVNRSHSRPEAGLLRHRRAAEFRTALQICDRSIDRKNEVPNSSKPFDLDLFRSRSFSIVPLNENSRTTHGDQIDVAAVIAVISPPPPDASF